MSNNASSHRSNTTVDTLVGRQTELLGDISFSGGLHIDGVVKGKVSADGDKDALLSVSETGSVEGDVYVANVVLNGSIHGDVHALGKLTLNRCARVNGNVHYKVMEMASGATVNGQMVHEVEKEEQPAANKVKPLESATPSYASRQEDDNRDEDETPRTLNAGSTSSV